MALPTSSDLARMLAAVEELAKNSRYLLVRGATSPTDPNGTTLFYVPTKRLFVLQNDPDGTGHVWIEADTSGSLPLPQ